MNKNPKERTEYIGIRVTPEEKERLKALAATAGMTITAYLLGEALGNRIGEQYVKRRKMKTK